MAFMKTSVGRSTTVLTEEMVSNNIQKSNSDANLEIQQTIIKNMTEEQVKNLLQDYKNGKAIGFTPTPELLAEYGM